MIDIHCHLLFGVDDGSSSLEESQRMLDAAWGQGVRKIILTPHYRHGMFPFEKETILAHFEILKSYAEEKDMELFLGCEYHVDSRCVENLRNGRCLTLAGSCYVLTEYSHITEYPYIREMTGELLRNGFRPVIAHAERCSCMAEDIGRAADLRRMGALIQINADSVLGRSSRQEKQYCRRLLKEGGADIIASDSHNLSDRPCRMAECRKFVEKKYGAAAAGDLFRKNPEKILEDGV